jgi:RNA polymerase sigma factor (sigma-70 family)
MTRDDATLLSRWAAGDAEAGRALVEAHFDRVYRFFRSKLDRGAEDLTQEVFAACVAEPAAFRGESSFRAFLLGVARRMLWKHYRKREREGRALERQWITAELIEPSPSAAVAATSEVELLGRALRRLPLDLQIVLELHYWEAASTAEIAQIVEIPVGTVKTRLMRARTLLRERIAELDATPQLRRSTLEGLEGWVTRVRDAAGGGV